MHISQVIESLGPLFEVPADMVRHPDHATSIAAARALFPHLHALHEKVIAAFLAHGAMTDETLENLPQFKGRYAPSTIRKRRSELYQAGIVVIVGEARNSLDSAPMHVWDLWQR